MKASRWAENLAGAFVALAAVALTLPNLSTGTPTRDQAHVVRDRIGAEWFAGLAYILLATALVTAIVIGQRRSPALRIVGWVGLTTWLVLKLI